MFPREVHGDWYFTPEYYERSFNRIRRSGTNWYVDHGSLIHDRSMGVDLEGSDFDRAVTGFIIDVRDFDREMEQGTIDAAGFDRGTFVGSQTVSVASINVRGFDRGSIVSTIEARGFDLDVSGFDIEAGGFDRGSLFPRSMYAASIVKKNKSRSMSSASIVANPMARKRFCCLARCPRLRS